MCVCLSLSLSLFLSLSLAVALSLSVYLSIGLFFYVLMCNLNSIVEYDIADMALYSMILHYVCSTV